MTNGLTSGIVLLTIVSHDASPESLGDLMHLARNQRLGGRADDASLGMPHRWMGPSLRQRGPHNEPRKPAVLQNPIGILLDETQPLVKLNRPLIRLDPLWRSRDVQLVAHDRSGQRLWR